MISIENLNKYIQNAHMTVDFLDNTQFSSQEVSNLYHRAKEFVQVCNNLPSDFTEDTLNKYISNNRDKFDFLNYVPSIDSQDSSNQNLINFQKIHIDLPPNISQESLNKYFEDGQTGLNFFNSLPLKRQQEIKSLSIDGLSDKKVVNRVTSLSSELRNFAIDQIEEESEIRLNLDLRTRQECDRQIRRTTKAHLKQARKIGELLKELQYGIDDVCTKVKLAKEHDCHPKDLTHALQEKADQAMDAFIEQIENEKSQTKNKKSRQKRKIPAKQIKTRFKTRSSCKERYQKKLNKTEIDIPMKNNLSKFAMTLMDRSFKCLQHPRIKRWKCTDLEVIKNFADWDSNGNEIKHYASLNHEEISIQRAKHFLPGTERLLKEPTFREIYSFPTDQGVGIIAQLKINNKINNGVLYIGCDKSNFVFHKYFEVVDFKKSGKNVFIDDMQNNECIEKEQKWTSSCKFTYEMSQEGVLKFDYAGHEIQIYPIQKELFNKKLNEN